MKIAIISIPDEFEEHFEKDRFEDSLHRLSADAHSIAGNYEQETAIMLIKALKNAKVINTNLDMIKALAPDIGKVGGMVDATEYANKHMSIVADDNWLKEDYEVKEEE